MGGVSSRFAFRFEDLIAELFTILGYSVEREASVPGNDVRAADIIARKDTEIVKAIEVKWTHRPDVYLRVLRQWSPDVARLKADNVQALLVASGYVKKSRRDWAESEFGIKIWDRANILEAARGTSVQDSLERLFEEAGRWPLLPTEGNAVIASASSSEATQDEEAADDLPKQVRGEALIARLDDIKKGDDGAKDYENLCKEIVDYLFGDALADPRPQARLDDKLSILDIVYRVKSHSPFWSALTRDFRARVIVFECKNYDGPVGPMQVFTTERYMSVVALRPICFVLSRTAAHKHAKIAAQGAMRETGKLLIFLDDEIIKKMLRLRDDQVLGGKDSVAWSNNEPTEVIDQEIYDFLATMPR